MTAMTDLEELLASLPGYSVLTTNMKQTALDASLIPDSEGVWPYYPDYVPTYDVYWAALSLLGFLQAQPLVRQSSSEGTSVAVDAPNWTGVAAYYRGASVIAGASGGDGLGVLLIPGPPHVRHVDMTERWNGYDNVDTDLA